MKKYRLKQWYPRIPVYLEDGYIISFNDNTGIATYTFENGVTDTFEMSGAELECTQYWELIKEEKPLFVTDDGADIFLGHSYILIDKEFIKHKQTASNTVYTEYFKKFKHESNADEYILWNKPLLSLQEIDDTIEMYTHEFEELIKLAKERASNEK